MPGLLLGGQTIPRRVAIEGLSDPNAVLTISATGVVPSGQTSGKTRLFKGLLDPTHSSLIAVLNNAKQVESPVRFEKRTEIKFDTPHELVGSFQSVTIEGPLSLKIRVKGSDKSYTLYVSLKTDHDKMFALAEGRFIRLLQQAQIAMESQVNFRERR